MILMMATMDTRHIFLRTFLTVLDIHLQFLKNMRMTTVDPYKKL
jgi:hypothetical protein